jgi:hypothetical protein
MSRCYGRADVNLPHAMPWRRTRSAVPRVRRPFEPATGRGAASASHTVRIARSHRRASPRCVKWRRLCARGNSARRRHGRCARSARSFAALPAGSVPNGIKFDEVGRFGHRLLVTAELTVPPMSTRSAAGAACARSWSGAPRVEGGIAVAPGSFGRHAGQLIAPDEVGGRTATPSSRRSRRSPWRRDPSGAVPACASLSPTAAALRRQRRNSRALS